MVFAMFQETDLDDRGLINSKKMFTISLFAQMVFISVPWLSHRKTFIRYIYNVLGKTSREV